jgi:predicted enzyme related to lactoylglutathione lyase
MEVTKHVPGTFCWVELGTSDQNAAKKFYGELFGWTAEDVPIGPDSVYTMFKLNGKDVGAAYTLGPDELSMGIPPYWGLYINVESADQAVKAIVAAGGTVVAEPFDVFDVGRMAIAQDPTGAHFKVWQPLNHIGVGVANELNAMCWSELATRDVPAAKKFYSTAFGWDPQTKGEDSPMPYTEIFLNGEDGKPFPFGGMYSMMPHMQGIPPHWMPYYAVADCDATVEKAKSLGAQIHVPPTDIPNTGRFSMMTDPQGAAFAVIKLDFPM